MKLPALPWWVWVALGWVVLTTMSGSRPPLLFLAVVGILLAQATRRQAKLRQRSARVEPPSASSPPVDDRPAPTGAAPTGAAPLPRIDVPTYPGPARPGPTASTSSDPVVSLGQLHIGRCGRDLHEAVERGTATDVNRVLEETAELTGRMLGMLAAAAGTPGSGRREFEAGLKVVQRLVAEALGEHPPGAKVTRVKQTCLRMGQTGRYE